MRPELLKLTPIEYKCPFCNKMHKWEGGSLLDLKEKEYITLCENVRSECVDIKYCISINLDKCILHSEAEMSSMQGCVEIDYSIEFSDIKEVKDTIQYKVPIVGYTDMKSKGELNCITCAVANQYCITNAFFELGKSNNNYTYNYTKTLVIRFSENIEEMSTEQILQLAENEENAKETKPYKEVNKMKNVTGIWEQIYEHSPKENVEIVKRWSKKYHSTIKWVVPIAGVYVAYQILNSKESKITVANAGEVCQKNLGIEIDTLRDKGKLDKLKQYGKIIAGLMVTNKVISTVLNHENEEELEGEKFSDCVENRIEKVEGMKKYFSFILPKMEELFPLALSVIIVYVMTEKPVKLQQMYQKVGAFLNPIRTKLQVYFEIAQYFFADKLNINLDDEEDKKKAKMFAVMGATLGVGLLVYGGKVLRGKKSDEKEDNNFFKQVLGIMKKVMPIAFTGTAFLFIKKVLGSNSEYEEFIEDFEDNFLDGEQKVEDKEFEKEEEQ